MYPRTHDAGKPEPQSIQYRGGGDLRSVAAARIWNEDLKGGVSLDDHPLSPARAIRISLKARNDSRNTPHEMPLSLRAVNLGYRSWFFRRVSCLEFVFFETASESLFLGKVVGIVHGCEIGDSFFGLVARIRIDDLDAISCGEGVEKI